MSSRQQERFDRAFRSWAVRPPDTPGDEAARQVLAKIPRKTLGGRLWERPLRLATAAVGLILIGATALLMESPRQTPPASVEAVALPPLQEDVVLLWLDDETPLYLTVAQPATKGDPR